MRNRTTSAFLASLACLGVGVALATTSPVRNTHDPTLCNVATAPPHLEAKSAQKMVVMDEPIACPSFQQLISEQSFDVAISPATFVQQLTPTGDHVIKTNSEPVIKDPGGTTIGSMVAYYCVNEHHGTVALASSYGNSIRHQATTTGVDTTAPPKSTDTMLSLTANIASPALGHGGGRNAEIV